MPQPEMNDLAKALDTFNNATLPTLSFFFVVLFLLVMGILIRGLLNLVSRRDAQQDKTLDALVIERQRITAIEEDRKAVEKERNATLALFSQSVSDTGALVKALGVRTEYLIESDKAEHDTLKKVAEAINKVNDAVAEIKLSLPTLATKSEMDMAIGRMDEAIKRLEEAKRDCIEKKHATGELPPIIPLPTPAIPLDGETDTPDALKPTG